MSEFSSSICEKENIVLLCLDGTTMHGEKEGTVKDLKKNNYCNDVNLSDITISDEELQFIVEQTDSEQCPLIMKKILSLINYYNWFFGIMKIIEGFISIFIIFKLFIDKEYYLSIIELSTPLNYSQAKKILLFFNFLFVFNNLIYFIVGIIVIVKGKIKLMKHYSYYIVLFLFVDIVAMYFVK